MSNGQVLLLIAAFVVLTLGSFIWFIATWDTSTPAVSTNLTHTQERSLT